MKKIQLLLLGLLTILSSTTLANSDKSQPYIANSAFTTGVKDRVPQDNIISTDNTLTKIFFFTDVRNLKDTVITHRWIYKDRIMADVTLSIGGNRWRTWSSKNLWRTWVGDWSVQVLTQEGELLLEKSFNYYK